MSIGSTIKRLRREKDITQEQLAEYLGITSRAIPNGNVTAHLPIFRRFLPSAISLM